MMTAKERKTREEEIKFGEREIATCNSRKGLMQKATFR